MGKIPVILAALWLLALAGCIGEAEEKDFFPLDQEKSPEYSYRVVLETAAGKETQTSELEITPGAFSSMNNADCQEFSFLFDGQVDHTECYYKNSGEVMLAARKYGLEPQNIRPHMPLLKKPFKEGTSWSWEGKEGEISSEAEFEILGIKSIEAGGRDFEALAVFSETERADGATIRSTRWYAEGIGLVKESMTITNSNFPGTKMRIELELE